MRVSARTATIALGGILAASLPSQDGEPARELERAVDLPSPAERRAAALALAKRKDTSLDEWLEIASKFGRFEPARAGVRREQVDVWLDKKTTESTELFVYVPPTYRPDQPAPLLLVGHGTGSSGTHQTGLWKDVADKIGMLVLAPSESGANEGYEFSARERTVSLQAIRWVRRHYNVDENRVYATGISRGGHLAWDLALRFPDRFAAIAPMVGGPRLNIAQGQNNLRYLENVAHMPIRDLQGLGDDPRMIFNLKLAFEKLENLKAADAVFVEFPELGHSVDLQAVDWSAFWGQVSRAPAPTRVVRLAANKNERRAFWVEIDKFDKTVREEFRLKIRQEQWNKLDDAGRRRWMQDQADERTARLAVTMSKPGRFDTDSRGVSRFSLLLTRDMLGDSNKVEVRFKGKRRRKTATPTKRVLLCEFVERFDRTFLPVARVSIP